MAMKQNAVIPVTILGSAQNVLPEMSSLGVHNCLYDIEHRKETPLAEQDDPTTACEKMDNLASSNKMMLYLSPDFDFTSRISADIAPFAQGYVIQSERIQSNPKAFSEFVSLTRSRILKANKRCSICCEVALGADQRSVGDAIASFGLVRPSIDGIYVANPSGNTESLISFLHQMAELLV